MRKISLRLVAAELIHHVIENKKTLDDALSTNRLFLKLVGSDRRFARLIATATLRHLGRIDFCISPFVDRPLETVTPEVLSMLRVGAVQLCILKKSPHSAVNETVEAARLWPATRRAGGFVNAVLRNLAKKKDPFDDIPMKKIWPNWLYTLLSSDLTLEQMICFAEMQLKEPKLHLNVKNNPGLLAEELNGALSPVGGINIENINPTKLPSYSSGGWWVQDMAATLPVKILSPQENETIVDLCAAPGGKTMQLALAKANVTAVDQSEKRMNVLQQNLTRTKLTADLVIANVIKFRPTNKPKKILLDAPCSAMGTLRRHPEGAWIKSPDDLVKYPEIQMKLLRAARDISVVGTQIVYSVCTPFKREGKDVINEILSEGGLERVPIDDEEVASLNCRADLDGDVLTIPDNPNLPCDTFFIARLKKV